MRFKIEKVYKTTSSHFFLIIALHDYVLLYILRAIVKNSVGRNSIEREREITRMSSSSSSNNNSIMKRWKRNCKITIFSSYKIEFHEFKQLLPNLASKEGSTK